MRSTDHCYNPDCTWCNKSYICEYPHGDLRQCPGYIEAPTEEKHTLQQIKAHNKARASMEREG